MGLRNKRPRRLVYSVRAKGVYSGDKIESALKHYAKLQKRKEIEGDTLWLQNATRIVLAKCKKYRITPNTL